MVHYKISDEQEETIKEYQKQLSDYLEEIHRLKKIFNENLDNINQQIASNHKWNRKNSFIACCSKHITDTINKKNREIKYLHDHYESLNNEYIRKSKLVNYKMSKVLLPLKALLENKSKEMNERKKNLQNRDLAKCNSKLEGLTKSIRRSSTTIRETKVKLNYVKMNDDSDDSYDENEEELQHILKKIRLVK